MADETLFKIFKKASSKVGLIPSDGKNYYSSRFCMINSQTFLLNGTRVVRKWYLNQRLVFGVRPSDQGSDPPFATTLSKPLNDMFEHVPWSKKAMGYIMKKYDKLFTVGSFTPNWFLPVYLGGYGIDPKFSLNPIGYSYEQRVMAARFIHNPRLALCRSRGMEPVSRLHELDNYEMLHMYTLNEDETVDQIRERIKSDGRLELDKDFTDDWSAKLMSCERLSQFKSKSDSIIVQLLRHKHSRLKPMSDATIENYRTVFWARSLLLPECPSNSPLKTKMIELEPPRYSNLCSLFKMDPEIWSEFNLTG